MKVVYSFIQHPGKCVSSLQKELLLCSPKSLKVVEPKAELVLYTDSQLKRELLALGMFNPFDTIIEDTEFLNLTKNVNTSTWWDLPKWFAISQEEERVFYSDYDIIYFSSFLDKLKEKDWVWCLELFFPKPEKTQLVPWNRLPVRARRVVPRYGDLAYNTGVLFVDPLVARTAKENFLYYAQKSGPVSCLDSISITQGALTGFMPFPEVFSKGFITGQTVSQCCEHFMGNKTDSNNDTYKHIQDILNQRFGSYLCRPEVLKFTGKFKSIV